MANKTLEIINRIDGTLRDYDDPPVLSDADATYGVRVVAGGTVIVPAYDSGDPSSTPDSIFTWFSTGVYRVTVTGLTAGVEYQYAITRAYNGASKTTEETFTVPVSSGGDYADEDDMSDRWGDALLKKVSQRNASVNAIDWDVVTRALVTARNTLNAGLKLSKYAVPLTSMDDVTAELLKDLCTRQALVHLYEGRIGQDLDQDGRPVHPAKQHAEYVASKLRMIRANMLPIVAAKQYTGPTGITVST